MERIYNKTTVVSEENIWEVPNVKMSEDEFKRMKYLKYYMDSRINIYKSNAENHGTGLLNIDSDLCIDLGKYVYFLDEWGHVIKGITLAVENDGNYTIRTCVTENIIRKHYLDIFVNVKIPLLMNENNQMRAMRGDNPLL